MSDKREVARWCSGFQPISLDFKGREAHHYTTNGDDSRPYLGISFPQPCAECTRLRDEYHEEMDRMRKRIEGEPVAAEPVPVVPVVDVATGPIQDVLAQLQMKEPEYAAVSGEA